MDTLSKAEQALLRRLSVFAGSFSLEAMNAVCVEEGVEEGAGATLLAQLVDDRAKARGMVEPVGTGAR